MEKDLRVFSIFDVGAAAFYGDAALRAFCAREGLTAVPIVDSGDAFDETVASLLQMAEGLYDGTNNESEGIVVRPRDGEFFSPTLNGRLSSFKAYVLDAGAPA